MNHYFENIREIEITIDHPRIISLVPSQTELLVDLGLQDSIVGITKFCIHPKELKKQKTIVGGTKQVNLNKITSLRPDIILCNKEENTLEMVKALEKISPVHVSDIKTLQDNNQLIIDYGKIFNRMDKAESIVNQIEAERIKFKVFISKQPRQKVAYLIWRNPWMTVGKDTFIHHLLQENNFENVYQNHTRYPEIDIQHLPEIDLLLLPSEPYPFQPKHLDEIPIPNDKIKFVDGEYFSWYGSRMLQAFKYFQTLFQ